MTVPPRTHCVNIDGPRTLCVNICGYWGCSLVEAKLPEVGRTGRNMLTLGVSMSQGHQYIEKPVVDRIEGQKDDDGGNSKR